MIKDPVYCIGKPCLHGHGPIRYKKSKKCVRCIQIKNKRINESDPIRREQKNKTQENLRKNKIAFVRRVKRRFGCRICKYKKCLNALEFHHLNSATKKMTITKATQNSKTFLKNEIRKCILVCANCHREIHEGLINVEIF